MKVVRQITRKGHGSFFIRVATILRSSGTSKMTTRRNRQCGIFKTWGRSVRQIIVYYMNAKGGTMIYEVINYNMRSTIRFRRTNFLIRLMLCLTTFKGFGGYGGVIEESAFKIGIVPGVRDRFIFTSSYILKRGWVYYLRVPLLVVSIVRTSIGFYEVVFRGIYRALLRPRVDTRCTHSTYSVHFRFNILHDIRTSTTSNMGQRTCDTTSDSRGTGSTQYGAYLTLDDMSIPNSGRNNTGHLYFSYLFGTVG